MDDWPGRAASAARHAVTEMWTTLGGAPSALETLRIEPGTSGLDGPLPVSDLALGSVGVAALAAAELAALRRPSSSAAPSSNAAPSIDPPSSIDPQPSIAPAPSIDPAGVGAAFTSERYLRRDGERSAGWAPLSGFLPARDGWVRTHANYDHHRRRLLSALDLPDDATPALLAARIGTLDALDVEQRVTAAGGLAVAVRTPQQWAATDVGGWLAEQPLLRLRRAGGAPPTDPAMGASSPDDPRPAAGARVLDLTRVIAGPIATRTLAHLGADVLRVDAPAPSEIAFQHIDTGFGKRSTVLDLADAHDRARFEELLASADAVIAGYRPGALAAYDLDAQAIHARYPRVVVATLSAWGSSGPWAQRRGFDSLVQAASGIAEICRESPDGPPGTLPAQALDHATGYLIAAAVLRALAERAQHGGSWAIDASLAQTATWLLGHHAAARRVEDDGAPPARALEIQPWLQETASDYGMLRHVAPPIHLDGVPDTWAHGPVIWGSSAARWL